MSLSTIITQDNFRQSEKGEKMSLREKLEMISWLLSPNRLRLVPSIVELILSCNNKNLVTGNKVYKEYFFAGTNPELRDKFSSGDLSMFESEEILRMIIAQGNRFEGNEEVRLRLSTVISKIIPSYSIDSKALHETYEQSRESEKSLALLSNHLSHFDAPILDYILRQEWYAPRFVCGSFMYYNPHVRPFTAAFDTIFVFGPKDWKKVIRSLSEWKDRDGRAKVLEFIDEFKNSVIDSIAESKGEKEIVVLFPYGGRAQEENGCKSEGIPPGMRDILLDERIMFCPMSCFWQRDAVPGGGGGNALKSFSLVKPIHPNISFGNRFVGWDMSLPLIHKDMLSVAERGMLEYAHWKEVWDKQWF